MGTIRQGELNFGAEQYVQALKDRILRHLRDGGENPAFVAGIFGEWGCGKTRWLERLHTLFDEQNSEKEIYIPVFFNAWRFEREQHLVVPMLKLAYHAMEKRLSQQDGAHVGKNWDTLKKGAVVLKDSITALSCGLSGKLKIPFFLESEFNFKDVLEKDKEQCEARRKAEMAAHDHLSSIYYDFQQHLLKLTGRDDGNNDKPKVSLVFLIDDVDRCLPEKAIEVLEAIKLFLEIEGCAFVLGLDEDVVTRGILHRYREYSFHNHNGTIQGHVEIDHPITGHEYLEKIIHLPVRVPAVAGRDAREFLLNSYRHLFIRPESGTQSRTTSPEKAGQETDKAPPEAKKETIDEELLAIFLNCVPHVPRKLIRAAELFDMLLTVARRKGLKRIESGLLLRLVILQLFAPDVYRFGRKQPQFFATMIRWKADLRTDWLMDAKMEAHLKRAGEDYGRIHIEKPLLELIQRSQRNRGSFDPRKLVLDGDNAENFPSLIVYYTFIEHESGPELATKAVIGIKTEATLTDERAESVSDSLPTGRPKDMTSFLDQMFSQDPLQWKNALEQNTEQLLGRVFDQSAFQAMLGRLGDAPQFLTTGQMLDWIDLLNPHLTPQQMNELYQRSQLLDRLQKPDEKEAT